MGNRVEIKISLEEQDVEKLRELAGDSDWSEYLTAAIQKLYTEQYILGESATLERLIHAAQAMDEEKKQFQKYIRGLNEDLRALEAAQQAHKDNVGRLRSTITQIRHTANKRIH